MESSSLRNKLHEYIDKADDRKLSAIYVLVEDELEQQLIYDNETLSMLHERRDNHAKGTSRSYTAQQSLEMIRGQKK